jgi:hypothetical protein
LHFWSIQGLLSGGAARLLSKPVVEVAEKLVAAPVTRAKARQLEAIRRPSNTRSTGRASGLKTSLLNESHCFARITPVGIGKTNDLSPHYLFKKRFILSDL